MECAACGTPLTPGFVACPACGTPYDLESAPPEDDDPPTETMPAVLAPAAAPEPSAPGVGLAPPLAPPPPAPVYVVERRRGLLEGNGPLLIGGLIGVLGALVLLAALAAMGGPGGFGLPAGVLGTATGPAAPATSSGASGTASPTPLATDQATAADGTFRCAAQELSAPGGAAWQLFRAEFGSRRSFDYLTLNLRRTGRDDGRARVRAEVMPPGEVEQRYGLAVPGGAENALVVSLEGPIRISGPFGGRPGHAALREFRIERDGDGTVQAVVAVNGNGCFAMSGADWQAGSDNSPTQVTLQIERP